MKRSNLDQAWIDSIAFAAVQAHITDSEERFNLVANHFASAAEMSGVDRIDAEADVAAAVAQLAQRSAPIGAYVLEVHEMDGGQVAPETFHTTPYGRASVWAGRVLAAAASGDFDAVDALIGAVVADGDAEQMGIALTQLFRGAAMVVGEMYGRQQAIDDQMALSGGKPQRFKASCYGGDHYGRVWDINCDMQAFPNRRERDRWAAGHIADWGHAMQLIEES